MKIIGAAVAIILVGLGLAPDARASVVIGDLAGDQFEFLWTETSPDPSKSGSAIVTIGPETAKPGLFTVSGFTITCSTCLSGGGTLETEDLSNLTFDGLDLGLIGDVTGTFLGGGGNFQHMFTLTFPDDSIFTDDSEFTFKFDDVKETNPPQETISHGTYVTVAIDEPAAALVLGTGLVGAWLLRRRRWKCVGAVA